LARRNLLARRHVIETMRGVGAIVSAAILLSSCGGTGSRASEWATLELFGQEDGPKAVLVVGDARYNGMVGAHSWQFPGGDELVADAVLPEPSAFVDLERGTMINVVGDVETIDAELGTPTPSPIRIDGKSVGVELDDQMTLAFSGGKQRLTAPPGKYVLAVSGTWPQGDAVFSFGIRLTPPDEKASGDDLRDR
jgi:hypothetical protein